MMGYEDIANIVNQIRYKPGWTIKFRWLPEDRPFIQIEVSELSDASLSPFTGEREAWKSGKHYLSKHMCRQEIVGAVFGAIKAAEEHEMREWFRYKGASIYNPHLDPDVLAEVAKKKTSFNLRQNAMNPE